MTIGTYGKLFIIFLIFYYFFHKKKEKKFECFIQLASNKRFPTNLLLMDKEEFQYSKDHPRVQSSEAAPIPYEFRHLNYVEKPTLAPAK